MAVNSQKFLPPSKMKMGTKKVSMGPSVISEKSQKNIGVIKNTVIKIDKLLKDSLLFQKRQQEKNRKEEEKKKFEEKEKKLEKKPKKEDDKKTVRKIPGSGLLDWIKNFIGNIILGFFAVRLIDQLPKLKGILSVIGSVTDFAIDIGGKLFNGLVTFIDWGYKAYDATRGFIKNIFGKNSVKVFDALASKLNLFLNLAIIAGLVAARSGGFGKGKGPKGSRPTSRPGTGGRPKVTTSGGGRAGGVDVRNPLRQRPKITTSGRPIRFPGTGPKITTGGSVSSKGLGKLVGKGLGRVPIVGGLIDFAINLALGEDPGRAAARAIGATAGSALGGLAAGAIGSIIPIAGTLVGGAIGSILGGLVGDIAGGSLYDALVGGPKTKKAKGGRISKEPKRKLSKQKQKYKRKLLPQKPGEVKIDPGSDIGGEEKLFGLFPKPELPDFANPFKVIKDSGKKLGESDYFGPILAITSKVLLGQKPSKSDYKNVGLGINLLIAKGISQGQLRGGVAAAYAEGGLVDPATLSAISSGGDISDWVAKTFEESTEKNTQKTLREILDNLELKPKTPDESKPDLDLDLDLETGPGGTADASMNPYRRAFLDTLAYAEGTDKYSNNGYNTMFTGKQFSGFKDHPRQLQVSGRYRSDAAGRYQFLSTTWDGLGLPDFSPKNQDKGALMLLNSRTLSAIDKGDFASAFHGARKIWASLPGAGYGQPEKKMKTLVKYANERLSKYKKGEIGKPILDEIPTADVGNSKGYTVTRSGRTIKNYSELPAHHTYQTTSDGRRVQDFTLYKNNKFLNIPVPSPVNGKVTWTGPAGGGGNWVEIQSKSGKVELGHFNKISVKPGQTVRAFKTMLGLQGYSGNISPPGIDGTHVHMQAPDSVMKRYINTLSKGAAYAEGGETLGYPHIATLGEEGKEIVIDTDSSQYSPVRDMLLAMNQASSYPGVLKAIRQYAPYDSMSPTYVAIPQQDLMNDQYYENPDQSGTTILLQNASNDPFESLDFMG